MRAAATPDRPARAARPGAVRVLSALVLGAALCGALAACGSTDGGGYDSGGGELPSDVQPVTGNVRVVLRTWDPKALQNGPNTFSLVNASSEVGQQLTSGRVTSTIVRVLDDTQMGALLAALESKGFSQYATPGMGFDEIDGNPGRRGILVVEQDGQTRGLVSVYPAPQSGSRVPAVFRDCKVVVVQVHGAVGQLDARASTGPADDPNRVFQAPPIRMPTRR